MKVHYYHKVQTLVSRNNIIGITSVFRISESKDINEYTNVSRNYSCEVTASTHRRIRMHILAICSPFYDFLLALDMTFIRS